MSENRVTMQQKKAVAERAKGCCEYCRSQVRFAIQPFSVEYIIPKSQGGKTTLDNLAIYSVRVHNKSKISTGV